MARKKSDCQYGDREFIKLNRKILDWEWYSEPCTRSIFIHCLLKANWRDEQWKGYECKRGQLITSLTSLAQQTGFSVQNVRTALNHLKSTGELTDWHDSTIRIITVCNYDKYQSTNQLNEQNVNFPDTPKKSTDQPTDCYCSKKRTITARGSQSSASGQQTTQQSANRQPTGDQQASQQHSKEYIEEIKEKEEYARTRATAPSGLSEEQLRDLKRKMRE